MIRVLHLVGRNSDFQNERAAEALQSRLGADFSVVSRIIGQDAGYGNLPMVAASVRREGCGLLHLFGDTSLLAVAVAVGAPTLFSPDGFPSRRLIGWLRAVVSYRNVHVLCSTATMQRALVENGIPLSRCPLVRPGVDFAPIKTQRNEALRAELGLSGEDHVLLAAGESTRPARHLELIWAASMLHILDPLQKVLLWGRGPLTGKSIRLASALNHAGMVRIAERDLGRRIEWEQVLSAADAVVVTACAPVAVLPIATAMASMRPIVSTVTYTVSELLEDRRSALLTPRRNPRRLAQRIGDLREDPALAHSIADRARAEAYEFFPLSKYLDEMRSLYRRLVSSGVKQLLPTE